MLNGLGVELGVGPPDRHDEQRRAGDDVVQRECLALAEAAREVGQRQEVSAALRVAPVVAADRVGGVCRGAPPQRARRRRGARPKRAVAHRALGRRAGRAEVARRRRVGEPEPRLGRPEDIVGRPGIVGGREGRQPDYARDQDQQRGRDPGQLLARESARRRVSLHFEFQRPRKRGALRMQWHHIRLAIGHADIEHPRAEMRAMRASKLERLLLPWRDRRRRTFRV